MGLQQKKRELETVRKQKSFSAIFKAFLNFTPSVLRFAIMKTFMALHKTTIVKLEQKDILLELKEGKIKPWCHSTPFFPKCKELHIASSATGAIFPIGQL